MLIATVKRSLHSLMLVSFLTLCANVSIGQESNYQIYVFYNKFCSHCKTWINTTGNTYDTDAPKILGNPIPRITKYDLSQRENMKFYQQLLETKKITKPIPAVPAFIIMYENKEINRTIGAMGKEAFYNFVSASIH